MATVTHYIYSHYDPEEQRDSLEEETGQTEEDARDPWQTESTFGVNRRIANPPRFVAAIVGYDQLADISQVAPPQRDESVAQPSPNDLGGWYRSLARRDEKKSDPQSEQPSTPVTRTSPPPQRAKKWDKNSWFISNVLDADPESRSTSATPAPTLADILSRDPPPLPSQERFVPPVFLTIGPSNKGFEMLQKGGWQEGEALGRTAARRGGIGFREGSNSALEDEASSYIERRKAAIIKKEEVLIRHGDDIEELQKVDVIDLTSDPEEDGSSMENDGVEQIPDRRGLDPLARWKEDDAIAVESLIDHNPRALLTPLPTILKSDRLGIGLKAKRIGPYGESVKRVTHSQAALGAHAKKNEEIRRLKTQVGRGRRGFERVHKKETIDRRTLLAYLNAD